MHYVEAFDRNPVMIKIIEAQVEAFTANLIYRLSKYIQDALERQKTAA